MGKTASSSACNKSLWSGDVAHLVECLPQGSGFNPLHHIKQVWWNMLIILVLEKWRQEEEMFGEEVSLDYVVNF